MRNAIEAIGKSPQFKSSIVFIAIAVGTVMDGFGIFGFMAGTLTGVLVTVVAGELAEKSANKKV